MANFFTIPDDNHLLQPPSVRQSDELGNVVDMVEYDILNHYRTDNGIQLDGYDSKHPQDSKEALKTALRHTIADVVSYRLQSNDVKPFVKSISRGDRSWDFTEDRGSLKWPPDWNSRLVIYETQSTSGDILWHL